MGVEYAAAIIVGLPVSEFEDRDAIEDYGFEVVAPYYDGDSDGVAGIVVESTSSYSRTPLDASLLIVQIEEAVKEFKNLTGHNGRVYLSTHGY